VETPFSLSNNVSANEAGNDNPPKVVKIPVPPAYTAEPIKFPLTSVTGEHTGGETLVETNETSKDGSRNETELPSVVQSEQILIVTEVSGFMSCIDAKHAQVLSTGGGQHSPPIEILKVGLLTFEILSEVVSEVVVLFVFWLSELICVWS